MQTSALGKLMVLCNKNLIRFVVKIVKFRLKSLPGYFA